MIKDLKENSRILKCKQIENFSREMESIKETKTETLGIKL